MRPLSEVNNVIILSRWHHVENLLELYVAMGLIRLSEIYEMSEIWYETGIDRITFVVIVHR